jgi:hypothetical protein
LLILILIVSCPASVQDIEKVLHRSIVKGRPRSVREPVFDQRFSDLFTMAIEMIREVIQGDGSASTEAWLSDIREEKS